VLKCFWYHEKDLRYCWYVFRGYGRISGTVRGYTLQEGLPVWHRMNRRRHWCCRNGIGGNGKCPCPRHCTGMVLEATGGSQRLLGGIVGCTGGVLWTKRVV